MTAWTMNAVSAAEPSVFPQPMSLGTLRKRKYLIPPTIPDVARDRGPLLEPGERVEQDVDELVEAAWLLLLRHQRGGCTG